MRKSGYYWVKLPTYQSITPVLWQIAYYTEDLKGWLVPWSTHRYIDTDFDEIETNRIEREKPLDN